MQNALLEHSAILSTFIKLPFVFKTFTFFISEWPLKTGLLYIAKLHFDVCLLSVSIFLYDITDIMYKLLHTGCETESPVLNGQAIAPKVNKIGSFLKYKCAQGHEPTGIPEVQCMPNGEWALPNFACIICEYSYVKT